MRETVWIRPLALCSAIIFFVSWMFPVGAGLTKDTSALPQWWGPVDVGIAFLLAIIGLGIQSWARGKVDRQAESSAYRFYRKIIHGAIVVAVLVMLAGDRIVWAQCATGFLWRTWLGLYILPGWLVAQRSH